MPHELVSTPSAIILHSYCDAVIGKEMWAKVPKLAKSMIKIMRENSGIGLAAPQVGEALKVVVLYDGTVMINPRISKASGHQFTKREGCLSIPGKEYLIERWSEVRVTYQDINEKTQFDICVGLDAQIVQHEIDHLNGKLLSDEGTLVK